MKKILIVAALLATAALPATPTYAAAKAAAPAKLTAVCFFLPLLPECVAEWKDVKLSLPKPAAPTVAMLKLPKCVPAKAGAGYLLSCK